MAANTQMDMFEFFKHIAEQNRMVYDKLVELHQQEQALWSRELGVIENIVERLGKIEAEMKTK